MCLRGVTGFYGNPILKPTSCAIPMVRALGKGDGRHWWSLSYLSPLLGSGTETRNSSLELLFLSP